MAERYRSRSYTTSLAYPPYYTYLTSNGVLVSVSTPYVSYLASFVENMTDVSTPQFVTRSRQGDVLNNGMIQNKDVTERLKFFCDLKRVSGTNTYELIGTCYATVIPLLAVPGVPPSDAGLISQAITEAHARVKVADLDLTVMAAELGETVRLIHDVGCRFLRIYKAFRKHNYRAIRKMASLEATRQLWLEYRYGMRPLYFDLRGVYNYLRRWGDVAPRYTARAKPEVLSSSAKTSGSVTVPVPPNTGNLLDLTATYERWTEQNISVRAGVLYAVEFSNALTKQLALLGIDRPLDSAWDLIPFSFVVDWFIGIGPFIASWEPKPGCNTLASWYTECREAKAVTQVTSLTPRTALSGWKRGNTTLLGNGIAHRSVKVVTRVANPPLPYLPSWSVKLNAAKLIDLAAIFLHLQ